MANPNIHHTSKNQSFWALPALHKVFRPEKIPQWTMKHVCQTCRLSSWLDRHWVNPHFFISVYVTMLSTVVYTVHYRQNSIQSSHKFMHQCSISKILEKIVAEKLIEHLLSNDLLYLHQYGFLPNRSSEQNLLQIINYISTALNENMYCIGIFLDLKKAFDVCSHEIILKNF
jgi:hypothetical protein